MTDRKPTAGFWITVTVVALLVGYPLTVGPAYWLHRQMKIGGRAILFVYRPILRAFDPDSRCQRLLDWYVGLGIETGSAPCEHGGDIVWLSQGPP